MIDRVRGAVRRLLLQLGGLALLTLAVSVFAVTERQAIAIEERIKPAGRLCLEGDSSCGGGAAIASSGPQSAEDIYNANCMGCHNTGAAGAPKMGDVAAWASRIDDKGLETVYANAINGIGGMPAKGLCMSCSDDEIKSTIDFILAGSQ